MYVYMHLYARATHAATCHHVATICDMDDARAPSILVQFPQVCSRYSSASSTNVISRYSSASSTNFMASLLLWYRAAVLSAGHDCSATKTGGKKAKSIRRKREIKETEAHVFLSMPHSSKSGRTKSKMREMMPASSSHDRFFFPPFPPPPPPPRPPPRPIFPAHAIQDLADGVLSAEY